MGLAELFAWEMLIAAFAGGAFGAAVGALQSFSLAGLMIVVGEVYALVFRSLGEGFAPIDITGSIGFGVVLGPHVAFGGGAAAVAFAAKMGYLETGFEYHEAKHVTRGLGRRADVLVVGGIFGIAGYLIATTSLILGVPTDPIALAIVLSALLHRFVLGYDLLGDAPNGRLNMTPFERSEPNRDTAHSLSDGGIKRLVVEPWLPYQYRWTHVLPLGVIVGFLGGYIAYMTASAFLAFGISVLALAFLCAGVASIPVTHHMSLPASTIVIASVDGAGALEPELFANAIPLGEALVLGAIFGVIGAFFGELAQRVFYAHADTHLDPPAVSIVLTSLLIGLLTMFGVLPHSAWIPTP